MAINFVTNPINTPRTQFTVGQAQEQFQPFADVYRQLWDFVEDGGAEALGFSEGDLATWKKTSETAWLILVVVRRRLTSSV